MGYGDGPSESGSLPFLGVSHFKLKIISLKCASKQTSFACKAGSSSRRREGKIDMASPGSGTGRMKGEADQEKGRLLNCFGRFRSSFVKEQQPEKRKSSSVPEFNLVQPGQSWPCHEDKTRSFLNSDSIVRDDPQESNVPSFNQPVSSSCRRSPIPGIMYKPVVSAAETVNLIMQSEQDGKMTDPEPAIISDTELEIEPESEPEMETEHELRDRYEWTCVWGTRGLNSMKLSELRALAKARGVKGFSKLKKSELVGLLSEE
ncbi:hypothetical protein Ancab_022449 [Ancistrocladus abbreviatus]